MIKNYIVKPSEEGSLLEFLANKLGISRKKAKGLLDGREVRVNGQLIWMAKSVVRRGMQVSTKVPEEKIKRLDHKQIIYATAEYWVINKPAGVVTDESTDSLEILLQRELSDKSIRAVHRLDRDTTGCVLFTRNEQVMQSFISQFRAHTITKIYDALVWGKLARQEGKISNDIDGQSALSELRVIKSSRFVSHVKVKILTGRTHQIRRHLCAIHHPLVGDKNYGIRDRSARNNVTWIERQMLHARILQFNCPLSKKPIKVEAPLPADFRLALRKFELE